jgi:hypothetical protein
MAKPKLDFKKLFMEKGEKITIVAAGVLMVLFLTLGILAIATSASTDTKQKEITDKVKGLETALNSTGGAVDPLDPSLMEKVHYDDFAPAQFRSTEFYVDLPLDNEKRGRPKVLQPDEFQVDLIRAPIYVYNFTPDKEKIFVLKETTKGPNTTAENLGKRAKNKPKKPANAPAAPGPGMGMGGPGMGGPGMGGPGMGMGGPGMGMGGPGMGMGGGSMGGPPGGMPGMGGPLGSGSGGANTGELKQLGIEAVAIEKFDPKSMRPARFVKPVRMVVVNASFPYKRQLEEFQKQLRYNSLGEYLGNAKDLPEFRGFNVQRQVRLLDGTMVQAWSDLDWLENYKAIYSEKDEEDYKDPEELVKFKIIPDLSSALCLPLPMLSRDKKYPPVTMTTINNALEKLKKAGEPPKTGPLGGDRFKGEGGPFGKPADTGKPKTPPSDTGTPGGNQAAAAAATSVQEAILIRFVDVNIQPGYQYEYRIQLKVANPNLGMEKKVGRPEDATIKELVGPYAEVMFSKDGRKTTGIAVPPETFVYAYTHDTRTPRPDHAHVQVQSWMSQVRTDKTNANAVDEVGDWIVEDLDVARGQYVAGIKPVKLPVWDPKHDHYQFKDAKGSRPGTTAANKGAVPIEFGAGALLVDFEGGKAVFQVKGRTVIDEPGIEMLMVTADGRLIVHNSAADKHDPNRLAREKDWLAWQEETKNAVDKTKPAGSNDPFGSKPGKGGGSN